jgi:hypothetical protein
MKNAPLWTLAMLAFPLAVGCGAGAAHEAWQEEGKADGAGGSPSERCTALNAALERVAKTAMPALATDLVKLGCDRERPCSQLLGTALPTGDTPELSRAIRILGCLLPVEAAFLGLPPPPEGIVALPIIRHVLLSPDDVFSISFGSPTELYPVAATPPDTLPSTGSGTAAVQLNWATEADLIALAGNSTQGVYRTERAGRSWFKASGSGSGLESTSQNAATFLITQTAYNGIDVLVGMVGSTTGGVYLSGDLGEHWMQVNQGFDPDNLSISTLVMTSCAGCPVQYYSGTYGSGVYTRTISVNPAPVVSGWCFGSTTCTCGTEAPSGPAAGGQPFKICGSGFMSLPVVEFGDFPNRAPAHSCTQSSGTTITCAATPPSPTGLAATDAHHFRVRNIDTRVGRASQRYTFIVP